MGVVSDAGEAIARGELVVYPTETVYGLGADATSPKAVERVFALKDRPRSNPLSVAIPDLSSLEQVAEPTPDTRAFMDAFLPGPVTVICRRSSQIPDILTAGSERLGIRIPAHPLATELLQQTPPLTATSANRSGRADASTVEALEPHIREGVTVVLDGGQTAGTASTVVDVDRRVIHRRGANVEAVASWLDGLDS